MEKNTIFTFRLFTLALILTLTPWYYLTAAPTTNKMVKNVPISTSNSEKNKEVDGKEAGSKESSGQEAVSKEADTNAEVETSSEDLKKLFKDPKWTLIHEDSECQVYKADIKHKSGLIPFKLVATLPYPFAKVLAVVDNTERKAEWVPNMISGVVVKEVSPFDKIERNLFKAPWPFSDREFLVEVKSEINYANKTAVADIHSVELPEFPVTKKFVRGESYNGNATIKAIDKDKTHFEIIFFNDFKGNLPAWIVNFVQKSWPEDFISKLRSQLTKTDIVIDKKFETPMETPSKSAIKTQISK